MHPSGVLHLGLIRVVMPRPPCSGRPVVASQPTGGRLRVSGRDGELGVGHPGPGLVERGPGGFQPP